MTDIMTQDVLIGAVADFPDGEIRPASMPDGTALAVYNVDGKIYATADLCTHGEASLSEEGILTGKPERSSNAPGILPTSTSPAESPRACRVRLR